MIKQGFKKIIKKIASPVFRHELNSSGSIALAYQRLVASIPLPAVKNCAGLVFSKNRAMQLHALLSSYFHYANNPAPLHILYRATTNRHHDAYRELKTLFSDKNIFFTEEQDFRNDLEALLKSIDAFSLFFMTDDGMFIDYFNLEEISSFTSYETVPSLIKGTDLTYCYIQDRQQSLPPFYRPGNIPLPPYLICWDWSKAEFWSEWAYPLSVDVSFFVKEEISFFINQIKYKGPNSLESILNQNFNRLFLKRKGICYTKAKYVNIVCNTVTSEQKNRNTGMHSIDSLLYKWEEGYQIDYLKFEGMKCGDAETAPFAFIKRT
ncbi:MAG: hypothetical protein JST47_00355 [Bacteroidetes bacterium]|nr:hypothetical protein [Bacteroidota bacterium]MBS1974945.1 hypothetical protein [Bacteroidota bacterium]